MVPAQGLPRNFSQVLAGAADSEDQISTGEPLVSSFPAVGRGFTSSPSVLSIPNMAFPRARNVKPHGLSCPNLGSDVPSILPHTISHGSTLVEVGIMGIISKADTDEAFASGQLLFLCLY